MSESPIYSYIKAYSDCLPLNFCRLMIDRFEKDIEGQHKGRIYSGYNPDIKESIDLSVTQRNNDNKKIWCNSDNQLYQCITTNFKRYCSDLKIDRYTNSSFIDTDYNMRKYVKGKGYFTPHIDCSNIKTALRFAACIIYLNDVDEGGETIFENWGIKVKPKAGRLIFFPTSFPYTHEGSIPISDDKYVVNTFLCFPEAA